jgi:two-component system, sensor histidine kinase LadS
VTIFCYQYMSTRLLIIIILSSPWVFRAFGQQNFKEPVVITDTVEEINFMPYEINYLMDSSNRLSFNEVSAPEYEYRFKRHTSYQNIDFQPNASYWIRLPIRHTTASTKLWLLEFYDQTIDRIEAFVPNESGGYEQFLMIDQQSFQNRLFRHKNFEILLNMKTDSVMGY